MSSPTERTTDSSDQVKQQADVETAAKEWKSWKLRKTWTVPLMVADIAIIVVVIALERKSATRNGIASVPGVPTGSLSHFSVSNIVWSYGLLWTTLPSLLMTLYRLTWDSVVSATADRQPFVELRRTREKATNVRKTIMLDYRAYPAGYNSVIAFRFHHWVIGFAMVLSLVLSIALVPLTAHLFTAASAQSTSSLPIDFPSFFNDSALTGQTDLQPPMSIASATRVFGGKPPAWMTTEYGFEPFSVPDNLVAGNITASVHAYSGYLDCQVMSPSQYTASNNGDNVIVQINDRGCEIPAQQMPVGNGTKLYAQSWGTLECSAHAHYSRVGLFAGTYSAIAQNNLANFSVISCIPSYWNTYGALTVSLQSGSSPQFVSFEPQPNNASEIRPFLSNVLESTLQSYQVFDPSATFRADAFGRLIYEYATAQNAQSPLDPTVIKNSTEDIYTAIYASIVATTLFQASSPAKAATGNLSVAETRLFVVTPVAYTVVVVLILVLICNIFLIFHAETSRSILREDPVGLLGHAALLDQSDVYSFVSSFRDQNPDISEINKFVEKRYTWKDSKCYFDDESQKIRIENLKEKSTGV